MQHSKFFPWKKSSPLKDLQKCLLFNEMPQKKVETMNDNERKKSTFNL